MDPVVTARVPAGIRDRGVGVLREIGSSTSELVNAAFDYVIQVRALPRPPKPAGATAGVRVLDDKERSQLRAAMEEMRVPVPASWNGEAFDELFDRAMEDRYAHLR